MHVSRVAMVSLLALSACYPFVSNKLITEQTCKVDADGDGETLCGEGTEPGDGDCDDNNAEKSRLLTEIPGDGWDNDCVGGDLVDVDGDGFPRITQADHEALGRDPFPSVKNPDVLDCDDDAAEVNPEGSETPYDGIDSNCDEKCDYDEDEDGFADSRLGQDNDCGIPATDCLDTDPGVSPDIAVDEPFNGKDEDCDGGNDYDADGDGYIWSGYRVDYEIFLQLYDYTDDTIGDTECYDEGDTTLDGATTDGVHPGAVEVWANGVDNDCSDIIDNAVTNDFDQDGDGYMATANRSGFLAYVARYVGFKRQGDDDGSAVFPYKDMFEAEFGVGSAAHEAYFDAHDNDCNDTNDAVHPLAVEALGDSVDQDCDGGVNTTSFVIDSSATFSGLGNPRLGATNEHFVLVANADAVDGSERVYTLSFPLDGDNGSESVPDTTPYNSGGLGQAVALVTQSEGYYTAFSWTTGAVTRLRTRESVAADVGSNYKPGDLEDGRAATPASDYAEMDLRCDGTTCWQVGCDGSELHYMKFSNFTTIDSSRELASAVDCFTFGDTVVGVAASGAVSAYTVAGDGALVGTSSAFDGLSLDNASSHGDWLFLANRSSGARLYSNGGASHDVLSGTTMTHGDVAFLGSTAYVAAVENEKVILAFGNPSALTKVEVPFKTDDGSALKAEFVAIEADGDRVMISAVNDSGDQLGWAFFAI